MVTQELQTRRDKVAADERELEILEGQLRPVCDMGQARQLAFAIVALLLGIFDRRLGVEYDKAIGELSGLFQLAQTAWKVRGNAAKGIVEVGQRAIVDLPGANGGPTEGLVTARRNGETHVLFEQKGRRFTLAFDTSRVSPLDSNMGFWTMRADNLARQLFGFAGRAGTWPVERQIPYDIAVMLRQACELEVYRFVPLIVQSARAMLRRNKVEGQVLEDLIRDAIDGAKGPIS